MDFKRVFKFQKRSSPAKLVAIPPEPPGKAPHVDWNAVADSFLYDFSNEPETKRIQGIFHPSSGLVEDIPHCKRQIMFDLLCAPRSPQLKSSKLIKILDNGTDRHRGLNQMFKVMAERQHLGIVDYKHDVLAQHPALPLSGEMDGVVTTLKGHRYVLDFKTINDANFKKTLEIGLKYRVQLNTYLGCSGIKTGYIIYENKNNQDWGTPMSNFRLDFDPVLWDATEQFCVNVLRELAEEKIPKFDQKTCDDNITFCSYRSVCTKHRSKLVGFPDHRPDEVKKHHLRVIQ